MLALRRRNNLPVSIRMGKLKRLSDCISLFSVHPIHTFPGRTGNDISKVSSIVDKLKRLLDWIRTCGLRVVDAFPQCNNVSASNIMGKLKKVLDCIVRFLCMGPVWYYVEGAHPYGTFEADPYGISRVNDSNATLVSHTSEDIRRREAARELEMYIHVPLCIF